MLLKRFLEKLSLSGSSSSESSSSSSMSTLTAGSRGTSIARSTVSSNQLTTHNVAPNRLTTRSQSFNFDHANSSGPNSHNQPPSARVTFEINTVEDEQHPQQSSNGHINNDLLHSHKNAVHFRNEEEYDVSHLGSSFSSYSGCINKCDNDLDDLHLHHDHNTKFLYKNSNHSNRIISKLNDMRNVNQMCDVCLVIDNEEINCHKSILVANSSYFLAMFSTGLRETNSNRVELKEIDVNSAKLLVDYMYTGELLITELNVQSLLITANLLSMTNVKDSCAQFIESQLDVSNCLGILEFSDIHHCQILQKHADAFIGQNFGEIVLKEEFLSLNVDQLIKLISRDHLTVSSEKIVFDCVLRWINHEPEKRSQYLAKVMQHVRFGLMNHELLLVLAEYSPMKKNLLCKEYIAEAIHYRLIKSSRALSQTEREHEFNQTRIRARVPIGLPKVMFLFGGQAPKAIAKVEIYDFRSQKWTSHKDMPSKRCRAGCVYYDGYIYLVGGFNGQSRVRSVDVYNIQTKEWSVGPEMICRRGTLGIGLLNEKIYAVGGFDGVSGLISVECWNFKSNKGWTMVAPLNTRRSSVGIAILNNLMYAVGGYCGLTRECLNSVEVYDPFANTWTYISHMLVRRSGACVNVYDGKIYVVGGHDGPDVLKSVEMYDPVYNKWTMIAELNAPRRNATFIIHNGLFYVIGGDDGHENLSSVEIYNPERNIWSLSPSFLNEAKSYVSSIIVENYC